MRARKGFRARTESGAVQMSWRGDSRVATDCISSYADTSSG